ncbi:MAG TPA: hypothetical protein VHX59_22955 [Mycobacteriales bacterium]|nr:hypothetical protein [Mycobacteriales bacterium]
MALEFDDRVAGPDFAVPAGFADLADVRCAVLARRAGLPAVVLGTLRIVRPGSAERSVTNRVTVPSCRTGWAAAARWSGVSAVAPVWFHSRATMPPAVRVVATVVATTARRADW